MDVPLPTYPYGKSLYKPYISLYSGCLWFIIPKNPYIFAQKKYHGSTRTLGVHPSLSLDYIGIISKAIRIRIPSSTNQDDSWNVNSRVLNTAGFVTRKLLSGNGGVYSGKWYCSTYKVCIYIYINVYIYMYVVHTYVHMQAPQTQYEVKYCFLRG